MLAQFTSKKSQRSTSLAAVLATTFVVLVVLALVLASSFQIVLNFQAQEALEKSEQKNIALASAQQVSNFLEQIFTALEAAARVNNPFAETAEDQKLLLQKLLGLEPALREVTLLDDKGKMITQLSQLTTLTTADSANQATSVLFIQASQGQRYISSVHFDPTTNEPLVTIAIPIKNLFGDFEGVLAAKVNLKFMWDLVGSLQVGIDGLAYVVDEQGNLLALRDTLRVLRGENLSNLPEVAAFINRENTNPGLDEINPFVSTGINGNAVLATYYPLGTPNWAVVVEVPVEEAYQTPVTSLLLSLGIVLVVAVLAGFAGVYLARRVVAPLRLLTETATRIAGGEIELSAPVEGPTETSLLARAFNSMTTQLKELIGSLEQRVNDRTRRLETAATLGKRMSSILNLEELLVEVVNQIKDNFGYYHAHIYLLDAQQEKLVVAEGTGQAGAEMKAKEHSIPLNAPTSLVARAVRTGQIVKVDNVREAPDWLPNPLLPETRSEMAMPIILEGQIVGVLDVQDDEIAGLDDTDANLLLILASQVAVAIRNAQLFTEVEQALSTARITQERYLEQGWTKVKSLKRGAEYLHQRSDATRLEAGVIAALEQESQRQNQIKVVHSNGAVGQPDAAVIAPINLQNQRIGTIQLHKTAQVREWNERELALVEAVINQVAQTAETLRLFDETREQASREQTIREITDKLRSAPTLKRLVEIATEELRKRLSATHAKLELGFEVEGTNGTS